MTTKTELKRKTFRTLTGREVAIVLSHEIRNGNNYYWVHHVDAGGEYASQVRWTEDGAEIVFDDQCQRAFIMHIDERLTNARQCA